MEILIFRKSLFQKHKTGKSKIGARSFLKIKKNTVCKNGFCLDFEISKKGCDLWRKKRSDFWVVVIKKSVDENLILLRMKKCAKMEILILRESLFQKTKTRKSKTGARSFSNKKIELFGTIKKMIKLFKEKNTVCKNGFRLDF